MTSPSNGQLMDADGIDMVVKGSPACQRAVLETVQALRTAGHECIKIDSPDCAYKNC